MTPSKRWPNNAEWARADSIARLEREIGALVDIVNRDDLNRLEEMRKMVNVIDGLRQVQTWLRTAGDR